MSSKILVTGGAGFVGSSLAEKLLTEGHTVVIADNLLTGTRSRIPEYDKCTFIQSDVNDYKAMASIMQSYRFDYVFHYAAVVGVQRTLDNPMMVLDDITGIKNILELSKNTGVKRLFYSSSSEVYGESVTYPQHETTTPLNSRLPYAVVKNVGEAFCQSFHKAYGLPFTILRFFNTYGPKQSADFVISKFIKMAVRGEDITVYGDGLQSRTFCYVDDNVNAVYHAFQNDKILNDVVNIGSDVETSIKELAEVIIELTGSKSKIIYLDPLAEGDMPKRQPDITKFRTLLDSDLIDLRTGLQRILDSGMKYINV